MRLRQIRNSRVVDYSMIVLCITAGIFFLSEDAYAELFNYIDDDTVIRIQDGPVTQAACQASPTATDSNELLSYTASGSSGRCQPLVYQWDIGEIPDVAIIHDVKIRFDVDGQTNTPLCQIYNMSVNIATATDQQIWDEVDSGSQYASGLTECQSLGNQKVVDLGVTANAELMARLADDIFGISFIKDPHSRAASTSSVTISDMQLFVEYGVGNAVTDLVITDTRATAVDLSWTEPSHNGTIDGYQINFTTPHNENVATITTNNTNAGGGATSFSITGLTGLTDYSFRVGYWLNTASGNMSGNVVNTTTLEDPTVRFTPGTFNITDAGTDLRDIRFEEIELSATSKQLNITFPNTFTNLKCDLSYEFAITNRTYENLDSVADPDTPGYNETSFIFTDVDNEIITAHCWNNNDGNGTYTITQTSIPFVNQIKQFQAGDFGTSGDFGAIDLVTLLVFGVIATLGFNRKNEAVGAFFLFALTFGLAWFEIITIPTAMAGVVAVVILLVIVQVRKD